MAEAIVVRKINKNCVSLGISVFSLFPLVIPLLSFEPTKGKEMLFSVCSDYKSLNMSVIQRTYRERQKQTVIFSS